eukprot:2657944-Rhodomonas_salina.1
MVLGLPSELSAALTPASSPSLYQFIAIIVVTPSGPSVCLRHDRVDDCDSDATVTGTEPPAGPLSLVKSR